MHNLLSAEIYKLKKDRGLKILLIVILGISLIACFSIFYFMSKFGEEAMGSAGLAYCGANAPFIAAGETDIFMIFINIFAGMFVTCEYVNGTIKNPLTIGNKRWKVYITKLFALIAAGILFYLCMTVIYMTCFTVKFGWGNVINGAYLVSILKMAALGLLLLAVYASIINYLANFIHNMAGVIGVTMVVMFAQAAVVSFCTSTGSAKWLLHLLLYPCTQALSTLEVNVATGDILIALGILVTFIGLGVISYEKMDVK